jgi:hypothetical protein
MAQPGWLPKLVSWRRYLARETGRQQGAWRGLGSGRILAGCWVRP